MCAHTELAPLAQSVERQPFKLVVAGSSPAGGTRAGRGLLYRALRAAATARDKQLWKGVAVHALPFWLTAQYIVWA